MLRFKKTTMMILSVFLMLILSACDPVLPQMYHFQKSELENKIVKIEVIHYQNEAQKRFKSFDSDHSSKLKPYDNSNDIILEELPADRIPSFLDRLSEADILPKYNFFDSPKCVCIKLTYSDGRYMILNCSNGFAGYIGTYSSDGEVFEFYGAFSQYEDFSNLLSFISDSPISE